jgi:hypothetical protein
MYRVKSRGKELAEVMRKEAAQHLGAEVIGEGKKDLATVA